MGYWKFIKNIRMRTGWHKWENSKMTLKQWLGVGNKEQAVYSEFISRINNLGGK